MKQQLMMVAYGGLLVWAMAGGPEGKRPDVDRSPQGTGVAVVELFTSEGCSSCPPADDLLASIAKTSPGKRVYALAMHVNYWDSAAWKDPFSDAAFSARQRGYAAALGAHGGLYTPQMVVNGQKEFVGSDRRSAEAAIAEAVGKAAAVDLKLTVTRVAGKAAEGSEERVSVRYAVNTPAGGAEGEGVLADDAVLHVALVEDGVSSRVEGGENRGRTLHHDRVVRGFKTLALKAAHEGRVEIGVPAGVVIERCQVIAYAQARGPGRVLGAAASDIEARGERPEAGVPAPEPMPKPGVPLNENEGRRPRQRRS